MTVDAVVTVQAEGGSVVVKSGITVKQIREDAEKRRGDAHLHFTVEQQTDRRMILEHDGVFMLYIFKFGGNAFAKTERRLKWL